MNQLVRPRRLFFVVEMRWVVNGGGIFKFRRICDIFNPEAVVPEKRGPHQTGTKYP